MKHSLAFTKLMFKNAEVYIITLALPDGSLAQTSPSFGLNYVRFRGFVKAIFIVFLIFLYLMAYNDKI